MQQGRSSLPPIMANRWAFPVEWKLMALRQNLWVESSIFSNGISVQAQQQQGRPGLLKS